MKPWYYAQQGERKGPVDAATVQALYQSGQLQDDDLVWEEGMPDWVKASTVLVRQPFNPADPVPVLPANPPTAAAAFPASVIAQKESPLAIVALVSGIISIPAIFCCGLLGIIPVITGHLALRDIKRNPALLGKGMAQAGLIMGYISVGVTLMFILFYAFILAFAAFQSMQAK